MDLGLANFPIQFPGRSGTSTVQVNITSVCMTTDAFPWPLSYICVQIISTCVSRSSHKKYLKRVLVLKMKLDLARARAKEEAEAAQMAYEHNQRMELRHLEEEASLAELEWKTETEYKSEGGLTPSTASVLDATMFLVNKRPHSTPATSEKIEASRADANPGATSAIGKETISQLNPCTGKSITPVSEF